MLYRLAFTLARAIAIAAPPDPVQTHNPDSQAQRQTADPQRAPLDDPQVRYPHVRRVKRSLFRPRKPRPRQRTPQR